MTPVVDGGCELTDGAYKSALPATGTQQALRDSQFLVLRCIIEHLACVQDIHAHTDTQGEQASGKEANMAASGS